MATATKKPAPEQEASENGDGKNKPCHVVSYHIGNGTYLQVSVWDREVTPQHGESFTVYDVSARKRMKVEKSVDPSGYKSLYSFRASEVPILMRALARAEDWILDTKKKDDVPF